MTPLQIIKKYYGSDTTERSKVPLINHIYEGLAILDYRSKRMKIDTFFVTQPLKIIQGAYCLHPIAQTNPQGFIELTQEQEINPTIIALTMEYRNIANQTLSTHTHDPILSELPEVNEMLVADKVQNYKDFMKYHYKTHDRSQAVYTYFHKWFHALDIAPDLPQLLQIAAQEEAKRRNRTKNKLQPY